MDKNYYIWIEIQANKKTIADADKFLIQMENCIKAGIGAVILSVKDTSGFAIYDSEIAPHYWEYDDTFKEQDYLLQCLNIVHGLGMLLFASIDVFAEGNKRKPHPKMPGIRKEEWQTYVYGLDKSGEAVISPVTSPETLKTAGSIDDFGEIFVNPANEEVCAYELSLLEEIITKYPVDGIVLDRVRYVGLSSDFGSITKEKWEQFAGTTCNWPEDIYKLVDRGEKEPLIQYGRYFGEFLTFRAGRIKYFIEKVRELLERIKKPVQFLDYTGSWYPLYYQVGANWASKQYQAVQYPRINPETYKETGYAESLDGLLSGFYYPYVTEAEAKAADQPAYWYSVEGSANIAYQVTENTVPVIGSLFLDQYRENPSSMKKAVAMCFQKSEGCMLFDLSYLADNDWWSYITVEEAETVVMDQLKESDFGELAGLWKECFHENFWVSGKKLLESTFENESFFTEAAFGLRSKKDNQLIGAVIAKKSRETSELYPDCAWLSALLIKPEYQGKGHGTRLYRAMYRVLKNHTVRKLFVGQDIKNLFSGIPDPVKNADFFTKQGFILNSDEHYDLVADILNNEKLDHFDTIDFLENFMAEPVKERETPELLRFLLNEFPGRWYVTVKEYLEQAKNLENLVILKNTKDEIQGFCMVAVKEDGFGGLGPIGIAKSIRGHKNGDFLLHQSLLHLRRLGASFVCIDWTILKDFYGKFNFKPVRIYRGAYKEINN
ncbi:GNAT family N-acetyltransferase [Anaerocolumna sp. AGMB13025]|uniref:GNAT family N-acetyltransferase n=1 Tax=Anaerocolumna sp. AGMB13025 TaxID=3039116 RepID=UPI00241F44AF|nr:GNAT family N-acetyltransferase [Anaerocolumna sp. AGMB13025]WFR55103.1 GNAT family N-acetyltransferase [Anaerocolumna sp. AGMB13025]